MRRKSIRKNLTSLLCLGLTALLLAGCAGQDTKDTATTAFADAAAKAERTAAVLPETAITADGDPEDFLMSDAYSDWYQTKLEEVMASRELGSRILPFYQTTIRKLLKEKEETAVYSPLNLYFALSILAETASAETRNQILELLGEDSIDTLRKHYHALWTSNYYDTPVIKSRLAGSIWLSRDINYKKDLLETLAETYYADSFSGIMGSEDMNQALQDWVNDNTDHLLTEYVSGLETDPEAVMELISTIYFKTTWIDKFDEGQTKEENFHGRNSDQSCEMMHMSGPDLYYWGDNFTAVASGLAEAGSMYFFLPDEGSSLEDVIDNDQVFEVLQNDPEHLYENSKYLIVNKAIPKFRVSSKLELNIPLQELGITDAFDAKKADFSPLTEDVESIYISRAEHAAMIDINEEGVTGAAYTDMMYAGAGMPPEEEVDFILDRPFLFIITARDGSILFAGTVYDLQTIKA